ncbi:DUF4276 family protein [Candidatus Sumerlaeota bacterium]|nr:DUF4276 family protein [Candidatus Sumerlaeota bacterium]
MIHLHLVVEGQTEETFARDVLAPHLASFGVRARARSVETGRRRRRVYRGGLTTYMNAMRDLKFWMAQDPRGESRFTTMFDLYALPEDFPGYDASREIADPYQRVAHLEKSLADDLRDQRFIPYLQLHEFEALLFSDPASFHRYFIHHELRVKKLETQAREFESPELINRNFPPSKRILEQFHGYPKASAGPMIAGFIGMQTIRRRCRHFDGWLTRLEGLPSGA